MWFNPYCLHNYLSRHMQVTHKHTLHTETRHSHTQTQVTHKRLAIEDQPVPFLYIFHMYWPRKSIMPEESFPFTFPSILMAHSQQLQGPSEVCDLDDSILAPGHLVPGNICHVADYSSKAVGREKKSIFINIQMSPGVLKTSKHIICHISKCPI